MLRMNVCKHIRFVNHMLKLNNCILINVHISMLKGQTKTHKYICRCNKLLRVLKKLSVNSCLCPT